MDDVFCEGIKNFRFDMSSRKAYVDRSVLVYLKIIQDSQDKTEN